MKYVFSSLFFDVDFVLTIENLCLFVFSKLKVNTKQNTAKETYFINKERGSIFISNIFRQKVLKRNSEPADERK